MKRFFLVIGIIALFYSTTYARYYDTRIGRFLQIDPKAQKYPGWSPYNYAANNPILNLDPDGKEVRVYTEKLNSNAGGGGLNGYIVAAVGARHSFMRVTTDKINVILELGGPQFGSDKGNPMAKDAMYETGTRPDQQEHTVERPKGVGENDFSFENNILEVFQTIEKNLPAYNGKDGPNSNGFIKFLINSSGGNVNLPDKAFGKDEINAYYQKYLEQQKKQEEEKKKENEQKQQQQQ